MDTGSAAHGFTDGYPLIFGELLPAAKDAVVINTIRIDTPLGPMYAGATAAGLCMLEFTNRIRLEKELVTLRQKLNAVMAPGRNSILDQAEKELHEYFEGKRKVFTVPLLTPGTDFEQAVWNSLQEIPYGKTCTYKEQAVGMNHLKAIRAIAATNGRNRLAIMIPCHRVIGSNGSLVGYAGGIDKKKWLLEFERSHGGAHTSRQLNLL